MCGVCVCVFGDFSRCLTDLFVLYARHEQTDYEKAMQERMDAENAVIAQERKVFFADTKTKEIGRPFFSNAIFQYKKKNHKTTKQKVTEQQAKTTEAQQAVQGATNDVEVCFCASLRKSGGLVFF